MIWLLKSAYASLLYCAIAYPPSCAAAFQSLSSNPGRAPVRGNGTLLNIVSECKVESSTGSSILVRESLTVRFLPTEIGTKDTSTWKIRFEKLKLDLIEDEKKHTFDLQHCGKREKPGEPTILELLQTDRITLHIKADSSCIISGYPPLPVLPNADVQKEIRQNLQFVVSEEYLRTLAMHAFPKLPAVLSKGTGWKIQSRTPDYLSFLGTYEFTTHYAVKSADSKFARLSISQDATTLPGKKRPPDSFFNVSGDLRMAKSVGSAEVDLNTRQFVHMSVESIIIGDITVEVNETKSNTNLKCRLQIDVDTSK